MYIDKNTKIPSVRACLNILQANTDNYGIYYDYEKLVQLHEKIRYENMQRAKDLCDRLDIRFVRETKNLKLNLESYLFSNGCVEFMLDTSDNEFTSLKSNKKLSFSKDSIAHMMASECPEDVKETVSMFQKLVSGDYVLSTTSNFLFIEKCDELSFEGRTMIKIPNTTWVAQNTGRIGTQGPNLNGFPRFLSNCETVPKGFVMTYGDSSQIEPREIYSWKICDPLIVSCILRRNDAYFGILDYINLPKEIILGTTSYEPPVKEITPEEKAKRDRLKTFCNAVSYGSTSGDENDEIKELMIRVINDNPYRKRWLQEVRKLVDSGTNICYTYFGTPIDVTKSGSAAGGLTARQKEKRFLNNPIQGTAADLMRYAIVSLTDYFKEKAPGAYIFKSQYDSIRTAVPEDKFDLVKDRIEDAVAYEVEGWIPIPSEAIVGRIEENEPDICL